MTIHLKILSVLLFLTLSTDAQTSVIKAGHMFDAQTGKMLDNQTIIIQDGKIKEVGTNLKFSKADTIIDLSNSWVLPGLMDCHVHLTLNFSYKTMIDVSSIYINESSTFRGLRGSFVADQLLKGGFTTVKEIGNDANYATADIIKAINKGWFQGPDIIYSGKIIAPYGGQTRGVNIENEHLWNFEYIDADNPDEIKKAIRKNIYFGANVIKMETGDNGIYDSADIRAAVDEAKKYGVKVTVHALGGEAARNVILGGAAAIEHGFYLDNDLLRLMKEKGTFLVGTDFSFDNFYAYGVVDSNMANSIGKQVVNRLKSAYKIGTKMAFGTDIIIDLPGMNRLETNLTVLETWKAAEIPPSYILQTMTIYAAELLGVEKSKGTIAPTFAADIIALKNNPLDDINAIKKVHFVMKKGEVVKRD